MGKDIREGNSEMERKRFWEANQGNPAPQICSCGIKKCYEKKNTRTKIYFITSLLKDRAWWG